MITVKVGRRGQITIPSEIRQQIGLQEGDAVAVFQEGDQIILRPITGTLLDIRGSVVVDGPQDFDAIRKHMIAERGRKYAQEDD
jgi:AbrB family looped-hinge helix DNA binding protein